MEKEDIGYMQKALDLAEQARGRTSPNPMVGALIVKDGAVVGSGYHHQAGTPHAEVHALKEAGRKAFGATMYVTLEPCSHHGRTPPCSRAVIEAGLSKVVVAMEDPNPLVAGRGIREMREAGIEVKVGVLEEKAQKLNEVFIKYITTQRPFVMIKTAMTMDGKIATSSGDSRWVTGAESRELVHRWRAWYDAILVGIGTVLADDPCLTCRLPGETKNPLRIVLDSTGKIPLESRLLNTLSEAPVIIATTDKISAEKRSALAKRGAEVLILAEDKGRPKLKELLRELSAREISSLFVEGGAQVNAAFIKEGLVDKAAWFVAPKIVGGQEAPGPVADLGVLKMQEAEPLYDLSINMVGEDLLIEGYFKNKPL